MNLLDSLSSSSSSCFSEKMPIFLRIRPIGGDEENSVFKVVNPTTLTVSVPGSENKNYLHSFSHIFDGQADQEDVYQRCCEPLVQDLVNGQDALLFCYGTTASGKTFTMKGSNDNPGIIPRALDRMFKEPGIRFANAPYAKPSNFCDVTFYPNVYDNSDSDHETSHLVYISFFEIYNDQVYDLLAPPSDSIQPSFRYGMKIGSDQSGRYFVKNLERNIVADWQQAMDTYNYGLANLKKNIQQTSLNSTSSRSHSFLTVSLVKFSRYGNQVTDARVSNLTFADLAGTERAKKTNLANDRLREGCCINNSLFALGHCLNQTRQKQANPNGKYFIPFNNSTLTKLFKSYLMDGGSKVWMIANINPDRNLLAETINALAFSKNASDITVTCNRQVPRIGKPIVFEDLSANGSNQDMPTEDRAIEAMIKERELAKAKEISDQYEVLLDEVNEWWEKQESEKKLINDKLWEDRMKNAEEMYYSANNKLSKKVEELQEQLTNMENQVKLTQEKMEEAEKKAEELSAQRSDMLAQTHESEKENLLSTIGELREEMKTKDATLESLEAELKKFQSLAEDYKAESDKYSELVEDLKHKLSEMESEKNDLLSRYQTMEQSLVEKDEMISKYEMIESQLREKDLLLSNLRDSETSRESQALKLQNELELLKENHINEVKGLFEKIDGLECALAQKENLISDIDQVKSLLSEKETIIERLLPLEKVLTEKDSLIQEKENMIQRLLPLEEELLKKDSLIREKEFSVEKLVSLEKELMRKESIIQEKDTLIQELHSKDEEISRRDLIIQEKEKHIELIGEMHASEVEKLMKDIHDRDVELSSKSSLGEKVQELEEKLAEKERTIKEMLQEIESKEKQVEEKHEQPMQDGSEKENFDSCQSSDPEDVRPAAPREIKMIKSPFIRPKKNTKNESPSYLATLEYLKIVRSEEKTEPKIKKPRATTGRKNKRTKEEEPSISMKEGEDDDLLNLLDASSADASSKSTSKRRKLNSKSTLPAFEVSACEDELLINGRSLRPRKKAA
ncbi:uncharacterized protein LOC141852847 [Brevipalpus obovatus]|uniref:uncharacterized protein LOC141852847 n=1 Tax=Brevipalpus obovatus TaxID=246614 RepID=UPI003D9F4C93